MDTISYSLTGWGCNVNFNTETSLKLFVIGALWSFISGCSVLHKAEISYDLSNARGACSAVQLPPWEMPDGSPGQGVSFRHAAGDASSTVLVAAEYLGRTSVGKFRLDMDHPNQFQNISDVEWENATRLAVAQIHEQQASLNNSENRETGQSPIRFKGQAFRPSGAYWPGVRESAATPSPDNRWLILLSQEVERGAGNPLHGEDPYSGNVYLDLFSVESGRKVLTVSGTLHNVASGVFYGSAGWLNDRYVVVSLDMMNHDLIFCDPSKAETN